MKLIIANWKMHPATEVEAINLAKACDVSGLVIAPPGLFLARIKNNILQAELGAQDLFSEASELKSLGVKYVIIGHSDRRALGETNEIIAKKLKAAIDFGLIPVLCVGESTAERAAGQTEKVISHQLSSAFSLLYPIPYTPYPSLVVAYEPLWAIGSDKPNTPQDTVKMLQYIKSYLKPFSLSAHVLYGGSVDANNVESFLKEKEVDGVLVGRASLKPDQIIKIVEISKRY